MPNEAFLALCRIWDPHAWLRRVAILGSNMICEIPCAGNVMVSFFVNGTSLVETLTSPHGPNLPLQTSVSTTYRGRDQVR